MKANKSYLLILIFFIGNHFFATSQINFTKINYHISCSNFSFHQQSAVKKVTYYLTPKENNFFPASTEILLSTSPISIPENTKHVAFFCKLEDSIFNQLNFWVKLRAGDDEAYRKFTAIK